MRRVAGTELRANKKISSHDPSVKINNLGGKEREREREVKEKYWVGN